MVGIMDRIIAGQIIKHSKTYKEFIEKYCPKNSPLRTCDLPFTIKELETIMKYFDDKVKRASIKELKKGV